MKKLVLFLLLAAPCFAQLTDSNLQAAQAELDSLTQQVSALNSTNASLQSQITTLNATISGDVATISQLNAQIGAQQGQILSLQQQLAQSTSGQLTTALSRQYANLQTKTDWVLASGAAGNTGATGSLGSCTLTPNTDGTATFAIVPTGAYYDCFMYRPLAGTWYSRQLPPAPNPVLGYFIYHVEYQLDSNNLPLAQALEMEARWYDGTYMYQMAGQIKPGSKTLRYYNWCATTGTNGCVGGWIDTGVAANIQAGQWESVDLLYQAKSGITTLVGVYIDGAYHPLNIQIKAATKTVTPWMHTSIQLDSNKLGQPYQALVRNIGVAWF